MAVAVGSAKPQVVSDPPASGLQPPAHVQGSGLGVQGSELTSPPRSGVGMQLNSKLLNTVFYGGASEKTIPAPERENPQTDARIQASEVQHSSFIPYPSSLRQFPPARRGFRAFNHAEAAQGRYFSG